MNQSKKCLDIPSVHYVTNGTLVNNNTKTTPCFLLQLRRRRVYAKIGKYWRWRNFQYRKKMDLCKGTFRSNDILSTTVQIFLKLCFSIIIPTVESNSNTMYLCSVKQSDGGDVVLKSFNMESRAEYSILYVKCENTFGTLSWTI